MISVLFLLVAVSAQTDRLEVQLSSISLVLVSAQTIHIQERVKEVYYSQSWIERGINMKMYRD